MTDPTSGGEAPQRVRIFTSYGRKDGAALAAKLRMDLEARGYEVWQDVTDLTPGEFYDQKTAEALLGSDAVLAILTPHATRHVGVQPEMGTDSYCLDEIAYARDRKPIVPVMAIACDPPWCIYRLQCVDMVGWDSSDAVYQRGFEQLLIGLRGSLQGKPVYRVLDSLLKPLDFAPFLSEKRAGFCGREWLFDEIEAWRARPGERMLLVCGDPGAGKSTIVAELAHRNPGGQVVAHHCCQADRPETLDTGRFVRSIAAMLASQINAYQAAIGEDLDILTNSDADPHSAWERVIIGPLVRLEAPPGGVRYILIDGLDEALVAKAGLARQSIIDIFEPSLERLPPWLRLVATSRRVPQVLNRFRGISTLTIDAVDTKNRSDVEEFLRQRVRDPGIAKHLDGSVSDEVALLEQLCTLSNGSFLYARQALLGIEREIVSVSELATLPPGLTRLYQRFFRRTFPDPDQYGPSRRLLAVLLAATSRYMNESAGLNRAQLAAVLGISSVVLEQLMPPLAGYLTEIEGGRLALFHKSLADWLTDPASGSPEFLVDPEEGEALLLAYCQRWASLEDDYPLVHFPAHLAKTGDADVLHALLVDPDFVTRRRDRHIDPIVELEDYRAAAAALLRTRRLDPVVSLATTENSNQRDGVALALREAGPELDAAVRAVVDALVRPAQPKAANGPAATANEVNGRRVGIRVSADRGYGSVLIGAVDDPDPAVRAILVPDLYRFWKLDRDEGWTQLRELAQRATGRLRTPQQNVVDVLGGVSFAMLTRDFNDSETLNRLRSTWSDVLGHMLGSPILRIIGRRLVLRIGIAAGTAAMRRQPDSQPLNYKELEMIFSLPQERVRRELRALTALESPNEGLDNLMEALADPDQPYDLLLMLAAERGLILQLTRDPERVMAAVVDLYWHGPRWFRQSCLYAGYNVFEQAGAIDTIWLDRYSDLMNDFVVTERAQFTTSVATYPCPPHLGMIEAVFAHRRPASGAQFLPGYLRAAAAASDHLLAARVIKACEILGLHYGQPLLALDALRQMSSMGGAESATTEVLVEVFANIRMYEEAIVDRFLAGMGRPDLTRRIIAMSPTIRADDFQPGVDAFFIHLLLTSAAFRNEICRAFRNAIGARKPSDVIYDGVASVVNFLVDDEIFQPRRLRNGTLSPA